MKYRVELDELLAFVDTLQSFEERAEAIASRVDAQIAALHSGWSGDAAGAHGARHQEWIGAATQMREALADIRTAANNAHRNYTDAVKANLEMLTS